MAKGRKNFQDEISGIVERPIEEIGGGADDIFNGIPISGDDILADVVETVSDRTVDPVRPEPVQVISNIPATEEPLPDVSGQESTIDPDFIKKVDELRSANPGKTLEELESMARSGAFHSAPPAPNGSTSGFSDQPPVQTAPIDENANRIGAQEIVDWYDIAQQLLSVYGYEYFSSPKESVAISQRLLPKIMNGNASLSEKEQYQQAQAVLQSYTSRKTRFSETVAMSNDLKERTVRLLEQILSLRGIQLSPEMLLGILLLTPLVVNGGRILLEKMGFGNADEMVGRFSAFVKTQEKQYWDNQK